MFQTPKDAKHIACARCRERKVKCDGGKPGCRRCQRNGHCCQYVRGKKQQSKSEWVHHLRTFSAAPGKPPPSLPDLCVCGLQGCEEGNTKATPTPRSVLPQSSYQPETSTSPENTSNTDLNLHNSRSPSPQRAQVDVETTYPDIWGSPNTSSATPEYPGEWSAPPCSNPYMVNDAIPVDTYNFTSSSDYLDTSYTSNFLTTSPEATFPVRSLTPTSQASGSISSDDYVDPYLYCPQWSAQYHGLVNPVSSCQDAVAMGYGYQGGAYAERH